MEEITISQLAQLAGATIKGDSTKRICGFSTDSRIGGEQIVFLPIQGEKVDGHDYIQDAYANGIRTTFTSRKEIIPKTEEMTYLFVDDTICAFQQAAAAYRDQFTIPVVGVTGSVGKTTTKEMIAATLSEGKCVLKTQGNKNSQIGLPQMMFEFSKKHEIAVIEMGMSLPGEMQRLVSVAKPQIAVISNIGTAHIGQLKSREKIRLEKMSIINEFSKNGLLLLNGENDLLKEVYDAVKEGKENGNWDVLEKIDLLKETKEKLKDCNVMTYGTTSDCDLEAVQIRQDQNKNQTLFTFSGVFQAKQYSEEILLHTLGIHNVQNALAALGLALFFNIDLKQAKKGLECYQVPEMRGVIETVGRLTLIDDSYNASSDSMKCGLDILSGITKKRRVAILGDILELGELAEPLHREIGTYVAKSNIDQLITVGTCTAFLAKEAILQGMDKNQVIICHDQKEACDIVKDVLKEEDAVFIKGSRGMYLENVVHKIKELFSE